jgi:hypothetical protein
MEGKKDEQLTCAAGRIFFKSAQNALMIIGRRGNRGLRLLQLGLGKRPVVNEPLPLCILVPIVELKEDLMRVVGTRPG